MARAFWSAFSGEPGIGKTTLVQEFLTDAGGLGDAPLIGRGHCSDRLAGTGAYLPVLEALDALLHGPGRRHGGSGHEAVRADMVSAARAPLTGDESAQRFERKYSGFARTTQA